MGKSPKTDITVSEIEMMTTTGQEIETTVAGQETDNTSTGPGLGPGPETDVTVTVPEMEIIMVHLETLGMDMTVEESTVRVLPEITDGVLPENLDISVQVVYKYNVPQKMWIMTEKEAQKSMKMKGTNTQVREPLGTLVRARGNIGIEDRS